MTHVLLLRAPSAEADGKDPYEAHFASLGLQTTSVPVYETVLTLDELQWIIETGAGFHGYKGVIVSSGRAVEAWAKAAENVIKTSEGDHLKVTWENTPFFVVGESTATAVKNLDGALPSHLVPVTVLGAEEGGTSEKLAHFILDHLANEAQSDAASAHSGARRKRGAKLLYLTGDKNRDTLPKILTDGGVELDSVQVYETKGSSSFATSFRSAVEANASGAKSWWIAFFAPSGADFTLPFIKEHFALPTTTSPSKKPKKKGPPQAKIAAIGPTTATHLREQLSLSVAAVAAKPGPAELASAIIGGR